MKLEMGGHFSYVLEPQSRCSTTISLIFYHGSKD